MSGPGLATALKAVLCIESNFAKAGSFAWLESGVVVVWRH